VTDFLQAAHEADERYTVRDGINIARFAIKLKNTLGGSEYTPYLRTAVLQTLGEEALRYVAR
jgi:MoxR-like ATPase